MWAFGCVLYEMLSGKRAFDGEDVAEPLAAVLRGEPDCSALPRDVAPLVTALVWRCLRNNRPDRVSDIGAALFALREASAVGVVLQKACHRRGLFVDRRKELLA